MTYINKIRSAAQALKIVQAVAVSCILASAVLLLAQVSIRPAIAQQTAGPVKLLLPFEIQGAAPGTGPAYQVSFQKTAKQNNCQFVTYNVRFQVDFPQGQLSDPAFAGILASTQFTFTDQLPAGLQVSRASVSGDVLQIPATVQTVTNAADTVTLQGLQFDQAQFSPNSNSLYFEVEIEARIDAANLAKTGLVENQAKLQITNANGAFDPVFSHDPAAPEDGDQFAGTPTAAMIDLQGCDPLQAAVDPSNPTASGTPGMTTITGQTIVNGGTISVVQGPANGPTGGKPCVEFTDGQLMCSPKKDGSYIFRHTFDPQFSGQIIDFSALNPNVMVTPAVQRVPQGGGTLTWNINGAQPGDRLVLSITGMKEQTGPAQGWNECCTRVIVVVVPVLPCPKDTPPPNLQVRKTPVKGKCDTRTGECTFRISVTNRGATPFTGPIPIRERLTRGNARIVGRPSAPWQCFPAFTPTVCSTPNTTLQPGQTITLDLTLKLPNPAAWVNTLNCAKIDFGLVPGVNPAWLRANRQACARPTPPRPLKQDKPKIEINKQIVTCVSNVCTYKITLTNTGKGPFKGRLSFTDSDTGVNIGKKTFSPARLWNCQASSPRSTRCQSKAPVSLPAGGQITVSARFVYQKAAFDKFVKNISKTVTVSTNCAQIDPSQMPVGKNTKSCQSHLYGPLSPSPAPQPPAPAPQPPAPAPQPPAPAPMNPPAPAPVNPPAPAPVNPPAPAPVNPPAPAPVNPPAPAPVNPPAPAPVNPPAPVTAPQPAPVIQLPVVPGSPVEQIRRLLKSPQVVNGDCSQVLAQIQQVLNRSPNAFAGVSAAARGRLNQLFVDMASGEVCGPQAGRTFDQVVPPTPRPVTTPVIPRAQVAPQARRCFIPGQVMTAKGLCACPPGTRFNQRQRRCTGAQVARPCPPGTVGRFEPNCRVINRVQRKPRQATTPSRVKTKKRVRKPTRVQKRQRVRKQTRRRKNKCGRKCQRNKAIGVQILKGILGGAGRRHNVEQ